MRKLLVVAIALALAISLIALPPYAASDKYLGANAKGEKGGTLVLGTLNGPKTLNDIVAQETSSTQIINRFMASMVERDNHGLWYPALATNWKIEITPEGKMVLYWYLRKGVKWSDGQPFTADDVVYTINNIYFNKNIPNDFQDLFPADNWPKAYKIDDYTVKVEFNYPYRLAWRYVGGTPIWPKHVIEKYLKEGKKFKEIWGVDAINNHEIVGLGPFIPVEYKEAEYVKLVRNPYYWKKDADGKQLPYLDEVIYKIIPNTDAMRLAFENGEIDVYGPRGTEYADFKAKAKEKGWVVGTGGPTFGTQFVTFNWNCPNPIARKWFRNEYFRKAVAYALDKKRIIDTLYNGLAVEQWGPISAAAKEWYNEKVLTKYEYSLDKAKTMLVLGGFSWNSEGKLVDKDGNVVKFILTTNAGNKVREGIGNILVENLKKLGMEVTFSPIDFNTLVQKLVVNGDWEAVIIGLTGGDEPQGGANVWKIKGALHFWNYHPDVKSFVDPKDYYSPDWEKEIDEIFKENVNFASEEDIPLVKDMFSRFQELVSEHLPLIYTTQQLFLYAYTNKLHNVDPTSMGGIVTWNMDWIWKEK